MCEECSSKSQLALLYSTSHKVTQHHIVSRTYTVTVRHQQTLTNPDRLSPSLSMTNKLRIPVYMCVLARQTSRSKPSAQRRSNIPYKATVQPVHLQISWLARYALGKLATSGQPAAGPAVDMRTSEPGHTLCKWLRTRLPDHPCAAAAWPVITTNENHRPRPVLYRFALALALARYLIDVSSTTTQTDENTLCTTRRRLKSK